MRIGELEDAVGKELVSRRSQLTGELARLPERLAEPAPGATAPAVPLLDSVHISPEARTAQFGRSPGVVPDLPFPGPAEIISILQDIETAPDPTRAAAGLQRLAALATSAARSIHAGALLASQPPDPRAAAIVAAIQAYAATPPGSAAQTREVTLLIRELLNSMPPAPSKAVAGTPALPPASRFEQAAAAILVAVLHDGGEATTPFAPVRSGELPPALLSMLGAESRPPSRRKSVRRKLDASESDDEDEEPVGEDGEQNYRPDPRRT